MPSTVSPGFSTRDVDGHVRLRAGMRLHVHVIGAEQRLGARDGGALGDVDELAAAVVAASRVPLGVLVGQDRSRRLEHGAADEILRRDQLEAVVLPLPLVAEHGGDFRVGVGERAPGCDAGGVSGHAVRAPSAEI